jgi:cell division protein FtsZ
VGGGGGNAVAHMVTSSIDGRGVHLRQHRRAGAQASPATTLQLGGNITKGLGAGANPNRPPGRDGRSRPHHRDDEGADMVFITAGMGGGTGTGARRWWRSSRGAGHPDRRRGDPAVRRSKASKRAQIADQGIELAQHVDSLITIPNEKLLTVLGPTPPAGRLQGANDVLLGAVQGIADLITRPGLINVDFADVRTVMSKWAWR